VKSARFLWLLVAGCSWQHPGREQLGDEAWHAARWGDAVEDYRAAGDAPQVTAKLADAALHAGLLTESAAAWTKLGRAEPGRVGEAAAGLARVAHEAQLEGKVAALTQAIIALEQLAPRWPLGRMAAWIGEPDSLPPDQATVVIPAILAGLTTRDGAEPLLLALGRADRARGACDVAVPILTGLVGRTLAGELHDRAGDVLSDCALTLGFKALAAANAAAAEQWFDQAAAIDSNGPVGRRARIAIGDARLTQGDTLGARAAWALSLLSAPVPADSLARMAQVRLLQVSSGHDSGAVVPPPS
jgi:hypothetical protein